MAAILVLGASAASAQPVTQWTHGTTLNLFAGAATASDKTGAMAGGAAGWEVAPWFGIEGSAAWLDRPSDSEAFAAAVVAHVSLLDRRPVVPFLKAGVGLYRATFDSDARDVPDFYRRRIGAGQGALGSRLAFTDPSFIVGGGVDFFATRHIAIRPEVEGIFVRRDARGYEVVALSIHLAYHFEDHPVTPARARRSPPASD